MSVPGDSSLSPGGGTAAASPDAVLLELKRLAERKASLKMFYAAADLFRDYKGPFANETAAERVRLADDYDQRGRAAEKQRLERGPIPLPGKTRFPIRAACADRGIGRGETASLGAPASTTACGRPVNRPAEACCRRRAEGPG